ncbi:MAG TPA: BT_3928 family protein [Chitinophagaceae bacterium]|nr:BT_3928 family protein [Chitinophagaceae bacterium]
MKATVSIARVIVGLLFIFSGMVKANDPLGLSYKMQEFFELWGMTRFNSWTLLMSVLMNAFEIIAGFALLLGWRIKLFSWLLLLLILFFTFLTGYTYITGTPKNCGCFGDCLPITSKTSFLKDVALTILIGFLLWKRKYIKPLFGETATTVSMLGITILSFGFQWYTLSYLPVVDCLPYKKGKNINEQMKIPAGARPDSIAIVFVYEKDGKQFEFSPSGLPADLATYKFISRKDKLIRKGNAEAPIHGFVLSGVTDEDSTQIVLTQPYAILLFCENFSTPVSKWEKGFAELYAAAKAKSIPAYMITSKPREAPGKIKNTTFADIPIFKCDYTALRTAARTNPCIYLLKAGTIVDKQSYKKMNSILSSVNGLPATSNQQPATSN